MDQKLINAFQKLVDINEPVPIKNTGITSTQVKFLEQLGLVDLVTVRK